MKREIKFRVLDIKAMMWLARDVENDCDPFSHNLCIGLNGLPYSVGDSCGDGGWCYEQDTSVVMQYTGLKDKIGREIFEGDVVQDDRNENYAIQWGTGTFVLMKDGKEVGIGLIKTESCLRIIGNIYENPDLIK